MMFKNELILNKKQKRIKKCRKNEEQIEEKIEKTNKKRVNAEYLKKCRIQQEENKKEDLNNIKTKIIHKIAENPLEIQQPKIVERIVEKPAITIKEPPDYNNTPEDIILK